MMANRFEVVSGLDIGWQFGGPSEEIEKQGPWRGKTELTRDMMLRTPPEKGRDRRRRRVKESGRIDVDGTQNQGDEAK